jgi:beta-glucosidase
MKIRISLVSAALLLLAGCSKQLPYQNVKLNFEQRTEDLVNRLTLEEKVQLMRYDSPEIERLGIPAYNWWNECLHGVGRSGLATVFPQAIGLAAMWDTAQMYANAVAISDEARAKHHDYVRQGKRGIYQGLTYWTPNINIFRDPRWGRGMETYGEDPYLAAEMAIPFIKGLQGDDPRYLKLVATAKHFAVHSGPEATRHSFDVWPDDYDLEETYFPHFKRTVTEAGVYSVMCAYQRLRGAPCCGSKFLENKLRNEWGFEGYIVSDCWAIRDFYEEDKHHVVATSEEAAAMAVQAGTDLNCGVVYAESLLKAVQQGLLTEDEVNTSVKRLVLARMKLGQFDPGKKVPYAAIPLSVVDSEQHRLLALQSARKSMVLLQNKGEVLPFGKEVKKVAVIGPNANDREVLLGNYNGYPSFEVTPLTGIKQKLPGADVRYAQGCALAEGLPCLTVIPAEVLFTDKSKSVKGLIGEYFNNPNFEGGAIHTRTDHQLEFLWWTNAPFDDMNAASFSVRWTGVLVPPVSGKYALGGEAMNGYRLYLDGKLISTGKMNEHHARRDYEFVELEGGRSYDLKFEYIQNKSEYAHVRMFWEAPSPNLKQEALELAAQSDLVILCLGLSPQLEGEEMEVKVPGFSRGDRDDIQLPASQRDLIDAVSKLGKPTVLVLLNGSALAFENEAAKVSAVLEAWYPGQAGGAAIADVIFGDYNPAGRLPVTFYKNIGQLPAFDDYKMDGKTYRYFKGVPQYEFGFGLSFTSFGYQFKSVPSQLKRGETAKVVVDVTNTGARDGEEVVQLYVELPDSKLKKAIRSLRGFKRIHLKAGETKSVEFAVTPEAMSARDEANQAVVETGRVLVSVGGKQPDTESLTKRSVVQQYITIL